ncbi:GDP-mannose-dependent alpha-(1-6)-phosphatidylinositol dimannoside mannosyltransferase [uncultured Bacteroides sp.]|uniref:glycosyltransferase n=1 Tax=Bacteroides cellulolyticus TaxID=2981780 RepID=UPI000820568E|nr:glycosyltransferase [Bacteroides cellulolyticus]MCU6772353.1 glycosyltransferase [Bacteroides cellulolyticus]SCI34536.1 GDP-mannose-dependent alpha-(1-6)-phosphatidylinositol dimannoside mannosyltransferase [uncultured Bacteroides sp.]
MKHIIFLMPAMLNGGAEKVLIDILKNFDYSKYDVTLLLETKDGPYIDDIPQQVRFISLHKKNLWIERLYRYLSMFGCKEFAYFFLCKLPLLWYLRGMYFDTIISFMEGMSVKMHSYIYHKASKNISWVHIDLKKKHWSLDFFTNEKEELNCYKKMDNIVFVSQDTKDRFKELFEINENKFKVIYNLIDRDEIVRLSQYKFIEKKKFTICMVGRLNQQKRYDRALEVAYKLKKNGYDLEFWVLGDGELKKELEYEISRLGLHDSFLLLGFVKQPYSYINQADILFLCSESEGFSLVVCEALCLGKPVVSTCTSGPTELIRKSRGGIIVNEDIDNIYNGLKQMIDNKSFREECSANAVAFSKTFNVQETMKRVYDLI